MPYCHCEAVKRQLDNSFVEVRQERYEREDLPVATRNLIEGLKSFDLHGATMLDIGAEIGTLVRESFLLGIDSATLVESAPAYLAAAMAEVKRLGYDDRVRFLEGEFVELTKQLRIRYLRPVSSLSTD